MEEWEKLELLYELHMYPKIHPLNIFLIKEMDPKLSQDAKTEGQSLSSGRNL